MSEHGYNSYTRGCRCDTCKAAKAAYMRERRAEANEAALRGRPVPGSLVHGTRYAYEERGCRCARCNAHQAVCSRHVTAGAA